MSFGTAKVSIYKNFGQSYTVVRNDSLVANYATEKCVSTEKAKVNQTNGKIH